MTGPVHIAAGLVAVGAGVERRYVVTRPPDKVHLGGQWELPGGKVGPGENPEVAVRRELAEELGVVVDEARPITFAWHAYPERTVLLLFFHVRLSSTSPMPRPLAATELRFVTLAELAAMPFPPANAPLLAALDRLPTFSENL